MKNHFFWGILLLSLAGCNKVLTEHNPTFEGTWFSEPKYNNVMNKFVSDEFVFTGNAGTYKIDCIDTCGTNLCECTGELTGKAEINKQKTMIRLNSQIKRTFELDQEPYEVNGKWYMEIDGKKYTKQ